MMPSFQGIEFKELVAHRVQSLGNVFLFDDLFWEWGEVFGRAFFVIGPSLKGQFFLIRLDLFRGLPHPAGKMDVEKRGGRDGLDPGVLGGGRNPESSGSADPHDADCFAIDVGERAQIIDAGAEVLDKDAGIRYVSWLARGFPHEALVKGQDDVTSWGQFVGIDGRALLFHSAIRSADDDGGVFMLSVDAFLCIEIASQSHVKPVFEPDVFPLEAALQCRDITVSHSACLLSIRL